METPRVVDHPILGALVGRWNGTEHLAASPWASAGTATATIAFRPVAGGRGLAQDYEQRRDGAVSLAGHGLLTVQAATGDALWWWLDSIGHPPLVPARGPAVGHRLVLERTTERGTNRTTFELDGDRLVQTIEVRMATSEAFAVLVEGRYVRG